jgi:hypothetical protein
MLGARELIVYPYNDKFVIIGGNMRFTACKELGYKELPCKVLPADYSVEQLRAITIKDNVAFGENDWENLANEWDAQELEEWGLDVPMIYNEDIDYSILDDYNEDTDQKIQEMEEGVKKAIQIEFEAEHYQEAFEIIKFWREQKLYIGGFLIEKLKEEKEKL